MNKKIRKFSSFIIGLSIISSCSNADIANTVETVSKIEPPSIYTDFLQNHKYTERRVATVQIATTIDEQIEEPIEDIIFTPLSDEDKELLARLVMAEAQGESFEGKVAVAEVVLNRVDSEQFPNSIKDVIYQKKQFSPVYDGRINLKPNEDSIKAVEEVMKIDRTKSHRSLYFYNPKVAKSKWFNTLETTVIIGNHTFKK